MRTSSCLPKTRLHNFFRLQASITMCSCVVKVQHDKLTPVLPTSPFFHHFEILANPIPQLFSVCCFHLEGKCIKDTLQIDPELPRYTRLSLFTMSAFDGLVTIGAKTGKRGVMLHLGSIQHLSACPVPF